MKTKIISAIAALTLVGASVVVATPTAEAAPSPEVTTCWTKNDSTSKASYWAKKKDGREYQVKPGASAPCAKWYRTTAGSGKCGYWVGHSELGPVFCSTYVELGLAFNGAVFVVR